MTDILKYTDLLYDSGATIHVCKDKSFFKDNKVATSEKNILVGNNYTFKVFGKGIVELQFASGKKMILTNVHQVLILGRI